MSSGSSRKWSSVSGTATGYRLFQAVIALINFSADPVFA